MTRPTLTHPPCSCWYLTRTPQVAATRAKKRLYLPANSLSTWLDTLGMNATTLVKRESASHTRAKGKHLALGRAPEELLQGDLCSHSHCQELFVEQPRGQKDAPCSVVVIGRVGCLWGTSLPLMRDVDTARLETSYIAYSSG